MIQSTKFSPGLDGIIAAETKLSFLDTVESQIIIRGYDLIELSQSNDYLDIVHLLLQGKIPDSTRKTEMQKQLKEEYEIPTEVLKVFELLPKETHPMDALRTGISCLAGFDEKIETYTTEEITKKSYKLLSKIPNIVANSYHILNNEPIISPKEELSYSANFYYMITGNIPTPLEEKIFEQSLLLYSEHEMPNSTFTARVIASTLSDLYGALTGAVASLKGNLHGGANEAVMYMLLEAKTVAGFQNLLLQKLKNKEKVMGFGHRVYMKKMDPRALIMKNALKELCTISGDDTLLQMCEAGEKIMEEEKGIYPNLDYYAAPVYYTLGLPIPLYTPIFFSARTAGLCAHVLEQYSNNKLFRPRVNYIGEKKK